VELAKSVAPFNCSAESWESSLFQLGHHLLCRQLVDLLLLLARDAVFLQHCFT